MSNGNQRLSADSPKEIADLFNTYFTFVFSTSQNIQVENGAPVTETIIDDIVLQVSEVEDILKSLDPKKATGPDEVPAKVLKETAATIAPSLCRMFNRSLAEGYIPSDWKLANVVPVHKKDEKDHIENYRPISLLWVISKVLKRCVLNRIKVRLDELTSPCQHGFRTGRSCVSNLLESLDNIHRRYS